MLVIMVMVIVGLEMVVMTIGTAIPESRLTANTTLINEDRQNVKKNNNNVRLAMISYTLHKTSFYILCRYSWWEFEKEYNYSYCYNSWVL